LWVLLVMTIPQVQGVSLQDPDCNPCNLEFALNSISEHYSVLFSYRTELVKDVEVSFEINAAEDFDHALNRLLTGLDLKYKSIDSRYYLLFAKGNENDRSIRRMERKIKSLRNLEKETSIRLFRKSDKKDLTLQKIYESAVLDFDDFAVEGSVVDEAGEPMIGVNIMIKGRNVGTTTDFDGHFILENVMDDDVLIVSYIGYVTQEIPAIEGQPLNI